jgi:iduronate 2-sulfatase
VQPEGSLPDIQIADEAVKFLTNASAGRQPFFLAVGFHKPHVPHKFPAPYLHFHPLTSVELAKNGERPPLLPTVAWATWSSLREREDIANR